MIAFSNNYWRIFVWVSVLLFVSNGIISLAAFRNIANSQASLKYTLSISNTFENLEDLVYDLQIEQIILNTSNKEKRINRALSILESIDRELESLLAIESEIEGQGTRIESLYETIRTKTQAIQNSAKKIPSTNTPIESNSPQEGSTYSTLFFQEINEILNQIQNVEQDYLKSHLALIEKKRKTIEWVLLSSSLAGIILALSLSLWIRYVRRTEIAHNTELEAMNENLERKVQERTQALDHYSNELKRSNRELEDFAFVASHDLQEPLRKIRAFVSRIQKKFDTNRDEQLQDYLQRMDSAAARMAKLIDDLLIFSRLTTKGGDFKKIDLNGILSEVLDDLSFLIEEKNASVNIDSLPTIEADETQMRQLFQNLISNALKFSQEGQAPVINISSSEDNPQELTAHPQANYFKIIVEDNGIGFEPEFSEKIFTPFQRLVSRQQYSGTGIGLAVCRRIVERHEGTIVATSEPGSGTKMTIQLPDIQLSERIKS